MSAIMRAKFRVLDVENLSQPDHPMEVIKFAAVCEKPFDLNGLSEDNTFARYTPDAGLLMKITNPALVGKINKEDRFYVDFTPADLVDNPPAEDDDADEVQRSEGEAPPMVDEVKSNIPADWNVKPTFGK